MNLFEAILANDVAKVQALIREGAEVNKTNDKMEYPLHLAAKNGNPDIVNLLLSHHAKVDVENKRKQSPLHIAALNGRKRTIDILLCHGADINARDQGKKTPLHLAVLGKHLATTEKLLDKHANPMGIDEKGQTPLHVAAEYGYLEILRSILHSSKAKPKTLLEAEDNEGKTCLHYAAANSNIDALRYLLGKHVNINAETDYGYTPIFFAIRSQQTNIVKELLNANASIVIDNINQQTPLEYAEQFSRYKNNEIINLLKDYQDKILQAEKNNIQDTFTYDAMKGDNALQQKHYDDAWKFYCAALATAKLKENIEQQIIVWKKLVKFSLAKDNLIEAAKYLMAAECCQYQVNQAVYPTEKMVKGERRFKYLRKYILEQYVSKYLSPEKSLNVLENLNDLSMDWRAMLANMRQEVKELLKNDKIAIPTVLKKTTDTFRLVVSLLGKEALKVLGEPPCPYALVGLGSMSREEMSAYSDAEFVIFIAENNEVNQAYFYQFASYIFIQLIFLGETPVSKSLPIESPIRSGFCWDEGPLNFLDSQNEKLIATPQQLAQFHHPHIISGHDGVVTNALKNVGFIMGDSKLVELYDKAKLKILSQKNPVKRSKNDISVAKFQALAMMRNELRWHEPLHDQREKQKKTFNVKDELYRLPNCMINNLSIIHKLKAKNSWARLDELYEEKVITKMACDHLKQAMSDIIRLRLLTHLYYRCENEELFHSDQEYAGEVCVLKNRFLLTEEDTKKLLNIYRIIIPFHTAMQKFVDSEGEDKSFKHIDFYQDELAVQGEAYERACQYNKALVAYQNAKAAQPNNINIDLALARIHGILGNSQQQKITLSNALTQLQTKMSTGNEESLAKIYIGLSEAESSLGSNIDIQFDYIEKALKLYQGIYGKNHYETAKIITRLANVYGERGNIEKQKELLEDALIIQEQNSKAPNSATAFTLVSLGAVYARKGDYQQSKKMYERALEMDEAIFGNNHPNVANTLTNLANTYGVMNDLQQKQFLLMRALRINEEVYKNDHPDVAITLNNLGNCCIELGNISYGIELLERALSIQLRIYQNKPHPCSLVTLTNLANAYKESGNSQKQKQSIEQAANMLEVLVQQNVTNTTVMQAMVTLGEMFNQFAEYDKAKQLLQKALNLLGNLQDKNSSNLQMVLYTLAQINGLQGHRNEQINLLERLQVIQQQYCATNDVRKVKTLHDLGKAFKMRSDKGDIDKAIKYQTDALNILERNHGKNSPQLLVILKELTELYKLNKDNKKIEHYQKRINEIIPDSRSNLIMHVPTGIYPELKYVQKRKHNLEQQLAINEQMHGTKDIALVETLINLAEIYEILGEFKKAETILERTLFIIENSKNYPEKTSLDLLTIYNRLSTIYLLFDKYDIAKNYNQKALVIIDKLNNSSQQAMTYVIAGEIDKQQKKIDKLLDWQEKALTKIENEPSLVKIKALTCLADTYIVFKQHDKASKSLDNALKNYKEAFSNQHHPYEFDIYVKFAELCKDKNDYAQAKKYLQDALHLQDRLFTPNDLRLAKVFQLMGTIYAKLNDNKQAKECFNKAKAIFSSKMGEGHPSIKVIEQQINQLAASPAAANPPAIQPKEHIQAQQSPAAVVESSKRESSKSGKKGKSKDKKSAAEKKQESKHKADDNADKKHSSETETPPASPRNDDEKEQMKLMIHLEIMKIKATAQAVQEDEEMDEVQKMLVLAQLQRRYQQLIITLENMNDDNEPEDPAEIERAEKERRTEDLVEKLRELNSKLLTYASQRAYTKGIMEGIEVLQNLESQLKQHADKFNLTFAELKSVVLNGQDDDGRTVLNWMTWFQDEECVEQLIAQGANVNIASKWGWTPLHIAAFRGHLGIARRLLLAGTNVDAKTKLPLKLDEIEYPAGSLPEEMAKLSDYPSIVELINLYKVNRNLPADQLKSKLVCIHDEEIAPAIVPNDLVSAVQCGDLAAAEKYLNQGADPNIKIGQTPIIIYAAQNADQSICELLLRFKAEVNAKDEHGNTAIFFAVNSRLYTLFELLLKNGAYTNIKNNNRYLLHEAVSGKKSAKIAETLLNSQVNVDVEDNDGNTPLQLAMDENSDLSIIRMLLNKGAKIDHQNKQGETTLHIAARKGLVGLAEELLKAGASTILRNKQKKTAMKLAEEENKSNTLNLINRFDSIKNQQINLPESKLSLGQRLLQAAQNNDDKQVTELLVARAFPDHADKKTKWTALHWAAWHGNVVMLKEIIKNEAEINPKNDKGWTPFYLAIYRKNMSAIECFMELKADIFIETDSAYYENNKPICWPLMRGLRIAKLLNDSTLFMRLQTYAYQQAMLGKAKTPENLLTAAVLSYNLELTKQALGKDPKVDLVEKDIPLLHYAVETCDVNLLRALVDAGADIFIEEKENQSNLLDWAVRRARTIAIFEYILTLGLEINRQRPVGKHTPLIGACFFNTVEVVRYICEKGADVTLRNDDGNTPLLAAAGAEEITHNESATIVQFLLEDTASDPHARSHRGANPLYRACLSGNLKILEIMLTHKVSTEVTNINGWTPIMAACAGNHHLIVAKFIQLKVNLNARNNSDWSVLGVAIDNHATESACLLIDAGAEYNTLLANGDWSALQLASSHGNKQVVAKLLQQKDIEVDIKNKAQGEEHGTAFGKRTALISAALNGHAEICEMLIKAGAEINYYDSKGWTPLKIAAYSGHVSVVSCLLKVKKMNPNYRMNDTRYLDAPLHSAIIMGYVKIVELLLTHPNIDVNLTNFAHTVLTLAIICCEVEIVKFLLQRDDLDITATDTNGDSPLVMAQNKKNDTELTKRDRDAAIEIEKLLKAKIANEKTQSEFTLIEAARSGDLIAVEKLLESGADINETDEHNQTALFAATKQNHFAIVQRLLREDDVDPNIANNQNHNPLYTAALYSYTQIGLALIRHSKIEVNFVGHSYQTPLMFAAEKGNLLLVKELLAHGADPNLTRPHFGNDGLSAASFAMTRIEPAKNEDSFIPDHIGVMRALLSHPAADPNLRRVLWAGHLTLLVEARNAAEFTRIVLNHPKIKLNLQTRDGYTALCNAAAYGNTETVYMLLARPGININRPNKDGYTPLYCAASDNHLGCVQALLKAKGIQVNKSSRILKTPLYQAAEKGNVDIVKALLETRDIDLNKSDKQGITPLIAAAMNGKEDIVKLLIAAGADLNCVTHKGFNAHAMAYAKNHPNIGAFIQEQQEQRKLANAIHQQSRLKEQLDKNAEERKVLLERQASSVGQTKENINKLVLRLKELQEEEQQGAQEYTIQQWEIEALNYIFTHANLKTFYSQLQAKLNELLLSYKTLQLLAEDELDKVSRTIQLIGKQFNLPIVKEAAMIMHEVPAKLNEKDQAKLENILNLIGSNKKVKPYKNENDQELDQAVKIATRLLTYMYEEQINAMQDADQVKQLAECAVVHFLNILATGTVKAQESVFAQLHYALTTFKPKEGVLKPSECKLKTAQNKVWTDKGVFQETGVRLVDGRCYGGKSSKVNLYGYRLGTENQAKQYDLVPVDEKKSQHPLKDNPFIVADGDARTQANLLKRQGMFAPPSPAPGTPAGRRNIDLPAPRKLGV